MTITLLRRAMVDERAQGWSVVADPPARGAWEACVTVARAEVPGVGLADGDRPLADLEVLAGAVGACEYALAVRLHAAAAAMAVPFPAPGGVLRARGWSSAAARRLARCGSLAARCPELVEAWAAGIVTAEHIDPVARRADRFSDDELQAIARELAPHWGDWPPGTIARFVEAADRMLHPPPDPTPDESRAYASRSLSFSVTTDSVILGGELPRLEGELVMAAIDAVAERLRSTADHVPAAARRADALVQLVNEAHAADLLPSRGGLPVGLTVTLDRTELGDPLWTTGRGHLLTQAEARWAGCDSAVTPVLVASGVCAPGGDRRGSLADEGEENCGRPGTLPAGYSSASRIAALAATLFDTRMPLEVGRTQRTATPAQRRALAVRDGGCIIPGCEVPAEACQTHHLREWSDAGETNLSNLALVCWAHHRQVDLQMWTIEPGRPGPDVDPQTGAPVGTRWPANRGAPFTVTRTLRQVWRS